MGCAGPLQCTHVKQAPRWGRSGESPSQALSSARTAPRASRRSSCLCFLPVCRRKELENNQAAWLSQAEQYENSHLGGYQRIYPACGTEKYEPFFKQSASLFQETAASKAREACARYAAPAENPLLAGEHGDRWLLVPPGAALLRNRCELVTAGREGVTAAKQRPLALPVRGKRSIPLTFGLWRHRVASVLHPSGRHSLIRGHFLRW